MKLLKILSFAALLGFLLGWPLLSPVGAQWPWPVDYKTEAEYARKAALEKKLSAFAKGDDAAGVGAMAINTKKAAEHAYGDHFQDLSDAKEAEYHDTMALGASKLSQAHAHMEAHASRMAMGDARHAQGDAAMYGSPPNYPNAWYCYYNGPLWYLPDPTTALGSYQHYHFGYNDADAAFGLYMEALGYFAHAETICLFP